jgi:Family of unknown function (DUF6786)
VNNEITFQQVVDRLEENRIPYGLMELQAGVTIVISRRGGRIFGPFFARESESIFWINGAFAQAGAFKEFLRSRSWNLGGDRLWIAPEIQYHVPDRSNFWGSVFWPAQVDPGTYALEQPSPGECRLEQEMTLQAYNLASGQKDLHLERHIRQVDDPLRNLSNYQALSAGVQFAGYEQVVTLSERTQDDIVSEAWSLTQLNPGGNLIIPCSPRVEYTDYYKPIDGDLQMIHANHVRLKITGNRQYKVGYKAAHVFGRLAYHNHLADGRAYLIVRNFFNNPSAPYTEEPDHTPGCRGHSIHVYNDDGNAGGFGELECNAQTIGGDTGRSASTDQFVLWFYLGAPDKVQEIGLHLLGIEL